MKRSTGLRDYMLATGSFKGAIDGKVIKIYSGVEPATADAALDVSNVLLNTITLDGLGVTGLTLAATATGGQITKNTSEVWEGTNVATGTAAFFRMQTAADDGGASTSAVRLQGNVALAGADLNFSSVAFVTGDARRINYFVVSIPAG